MINLLKLDSFQKKNILYLTQVKLSFLFECAAHTHTNTQGLFKGLSLSQLLTTCIVLIFMKRSSRRRRRRRPRRQLAAQLFAQSVQGEGNERGRWSATSTCPTLHCLAAGDPFKALANLIRATTAEQPEKLSLLSNRAKVFKVAQAPRRHTPPPPPPPSSSRHAPQIASPDWAEAKVAMTGRANEPASWLNWTELNPINMHKMHALPYDSI